MSVAAGRIGRSAVDTPGRHSRPIATRAGRRRAHRRRRPRQTNQTNGATRSPPNGTPPVTSRAQATARTPKTTTPRRQDRAMSSVHSSTRMKPPSPQTSGGDCRAEHRQMTSCPRQLPQVLDAVRSTPWCTRPATVGRQHTPRWRGGSVRRRIEPLPPGHPLQPTFPRIIAGNRWEIAFDPHCSTRKITWRLHMVGLDLSHHPRIERGLELVDPLPAAAEGYSAP